MSQNRSQPKVVAAQGVSNSSQPCVAAVVSGTTNACERFYRVLMVGNSYTSSQDLPRLVAERTGWDVQSLTRSGARLSEFFSPKTKTGARLASLFAEVARGEYQLDAVVLQDMSRGPADTPEAYARSIDAACEQVRTIGAMPIVYATWAYAPDGPAIKKRPYTHEEMHRRLQASFIAAAERNHCPLANVGAAFEALWQQDPHAPLLGKDGSHPTPEAAQRAADVLAHQLQTALAPRPE